VTAAFYKWVSENDKKMVSHGHNGALAVGDTLLYSSARSSELRFDSITESVLLKHVKP
jgi:hypothetical protein